jgi:hypothetical protein
MFFKSINMIIIIKQSDILLEEVLTHQEKQMKRSRLIMNLFSIKTPYVVVVVFISLLNYLTTTTRVNKESTRLKIINHY